MSKKVNFGRISLHFVLSKASLRGYTCGYFMCVYVFWFVSESIAEIKILTVRAYSIRLNPHFRTLIRDEYDSMYN